MKSLLWVCIVVLATACGNGSGRSEEGKAAADEKAAATDGVEEGSGKEISPQLEMDSADARFDVDTISSSEEAKKEEAESF